MHSRWIIPEKIYEMQIKIMSKKVSDLIGIDCIR